MLAPIVTPVRSHSALGVAPCTAATPVARVDRMNDSKDDFLLFRNSKGKVSLLYRQEIGGFKLMEIESHERVKPENTK